MKDIYLYEDMPVLKNLLNIKDIKALDEAESGITYIKLLDIDRAIDSLYFDLQRIYDIHKHIFGNIYSWAGAPRVTQIFKGERVLGGDTVRYAEPDNIEKECQAVLTAMNNVDWASLSVDETATQFSQLIARLWQVHPFREGNTRTIITFATQFAEAHAFPMDKTLLKEKSDYVRDALVKASDGEYSEYGYLIQVFKSAILRG